MNSQSQDYLARLLAKENLTVLRGNFSTASFDVANRVLKLPLWADKGKAVADLLIGHEVGHALYTPSEGWHDSEKVIPGVPKSMINIIEDIRIEKKIQETYPGIRKSFKEGYKVLFDDDLFGTVGQDLTEYGFMDRLNIFTKGRGYAPIEFSEEEQYYVDQAVAVGTWEDVLNVCKDINLWLLSKEEEEENDEQENEGTEESDSMEQSGQDDCDDEGSTKEEEEPVDQRVSKTDQAQRDNESDLFETTENGKQPAYSDGITDYQVDRIVTKVKDTMRLREEDSRDNPYTNEVLGQAFKESLKKSKPVVNAMVREFERKKAAFEYSRSQTAKKGSLDVNKLHQYQYSEDIFQTVTKLAEAKSHGLVVVIDWSGSMRGIVADVVNQTIQLALFCKRVNIPFEFYSFTSGPSKNDQLNDDIGSFDDLDLLKLIELTNNNLSKTDFMKSLQQLFAAAAACHGSGRYDADISYYDLADVDRMGSTPLIQTTMVMATLVKRFQMRNAIQNTNIIIMTDGDANYVSFNTDSTVCEVDRQNVVVNFKGIMVKAKSTEEIYAGCVSALKEYTNSTVMCLFLASNHSEAGWGYEKMNGVFTMSPKDKKTYKDTGVLTQSNVKGFDEFTIVKVGNKAAEFEFEVKGNAAIKDVTREFRKFSKTKKQTKRLVTTITDVLAA